MASPGNRLRAHNCCRRALRHVDELLQPLLKAGRLHVISVASKTRIAPPDVLRIAPAFPAATQRTDMTVQDSRCRQGVRENILIELRVSPRKRDGPNIYELPDAVPSEQAQKFLDRPRGMADGPETLFSHVSLICCGCGT